MMRNVDFDYIPHSNLEAYLNNLKLCAYFSLKTKLDNMLRAGHASGDSGEEDQTYTGLEDTGSWYPNLSEHLDVLEIHLLD